MTERAARALCPGCHHADEAASLLSSAAEVGPGPAVARPRRCRLRGESRPARHRGGAAGERAPAGRRKMCSCGAVRVRSLVPTSHLGNFFSCLVCGHLCTLLSAFHSTCVCFPKLARNGELVRSSKLVYHDRLDVSPEWCISISHGVTPVRCVPLSGYQRCQSRSLMRSRPRIPFLNRFMCCDGASQQRGGFGPLCWERATSIDD